MIKSWKLLSGGGGGGVRLEVFKFGRFNTRQTLIGDEVNTSRRAPCVLDLGPGVYCVQSFLPIYGRAKRADNWVLDNSVTEEGNTTETPMDSWIGRVRPGKDLTKPTNMSDYLIGLVLTCLNCFCYAQFWYCEFMVFLVKYGDGELWIIRCWWQRQNTKQVQVWKTYVRRI